MTRVPPVLRVALAFALGAALAPGSLTGPRGLLTPALLLLLLASTWAWRVPPLLPSLVHLAPAALAGALWAASADAASRPACLAEQVDGAALELTGHFTRVRAQGSSRFHVAGGLGPGCFPVLTVYVRGETGAVEARFGTLEGRWLTGRRDQGIGGYFSAGTFLETLGPVPRRHRVRAAFGRGVETVLERRFGERASVARALTIAGGEGVDPHLREAFVRSGVAHLLSISGFHVGVVGGLLAGMAAGLGLPPRARAGVLAGGVWLYVALIGAPTSAARAAWMTSALVLGTIRGRPVLRLGALGCAMLVLAVVEPGAVGGPGYQLTVAGTAGILFVGRWIARHWPEGPVVGALGPSVGAGLGAALFTAPILALHFGALSTVSVPASLLLTPLVAVAIPGIVATIALDLTGLPGASVVAYGTDALLMGLSATARAFAALPWASVPVTAQEVAVALIFALASLRLLRSPWRVAAWIRIWLAVSGGAAGVMGLRVVRDLAAWNSMEVTAIDVGQGDAIAIRTPRNRWYLIDGGPRSATFDVGASRVVPYLQRRGVRRLEAIVLSHPDSDHVGGLAAILQAFPVGAVLGPGRTAGQVAHVDALEQARRTNTPWRRVVTGDAWSRDGVSFEILHPGTEDLGDHPNDWSVVILSRFGAFEALFMGDAEEAAESRVLATLESGEVEVLKVGHHGSRTSTSQALLDRVSPRVALISAGRRNRYGHPAPQVLRRLRESGATILRTDASGTVSVTGRRNGSLRTGGRVPRYPGR